MANSLTDQRCFNHAEREAAARCPECSRFFCRECVTEHEDRVLCAACLRKLAGASSSARRRLAAVRKLSLCALSLFVAWLFFWLFGQVLLAIPSTFHKTTLWR